MPVRWGWPWSQAPSYNVQTAVDADTGLIVHHDVTDEPTDRRQLYPMASATKQSLGLDAMTVVADKGFDNGEHASACERDGIVACVPSQRSVNNQGDGMLFDRTAQARCRHPADLPGGRPRCGLGHTVRAAG